MSIQRATEVDYAEFVGKTRHLSETIGDNDLRPYGLFGMLGRGRQTAVKQTRLLHKCGGRVEFSRGGGAQYVAFHHDLGSFAVKTCKVDNKNDDDNSLYTS